MSSTSSLPSEISIAAATAKALASSASRSGCSSPDLVCAYRNTPPIPSRSASATVSVSVRRARIEFMRRSSQRARDERVAEPALRADDRRMALHVELAPQAAHRGVDGIARRLADFVEEARLDLRALHVFAAAEGEVLE